MALFKMPTFKGYSSLHSTFWVNIFSLTVALIVFFAFTDEIPLTTISWYGLIWGVLFAFTTAQQKILLGRMETNILLPVTSSLSNVLTVFAGIFIFSEQLSGLQYVATLIILLCTFLYSRKKGGLILNRYAVLFGLGIIISSTLGKVVQKTGAVHESIIHFAVYQYIGATICAFLLVYLFQPSSLKRLHKIEDTWKISLVAGLFMAIAGYAFLLALASGPLAGVYLIAGAYTFVAALFGVWLYKEKLTRYKLFLMALAFIGIILMKIG
ncbi:MAG: EamA family transporter [Candidatus Pacebacteria bacterium]|nr:EamA family transporter [Candidatus Paceibacterota bacterium]